MLSYPDYYEAICDLNAIRLKLHCLAGLLAAETLKALVLCFECRNLERNLLSVCDNLTSLLTAASKKHGR